MSPPAPHASSDAHGSRPVKEVIAPGPGHFVGDGFDVRTVFGPQRDPRATSPFVLLDFGARRNFSPTTRRRGVGPHPHRGFETVTFVYAGEVEHRDSAGGGGVIGPGDVQWMTAGAGVVHAEYHSAAYARRGGPFEVLQLWVNLPARFKMVPPRYQTLAAKDIPQASCGAARCRVVAGRILGCTGPARTYTPMVVMDGRFETEGTLSLSPAADWNVLVLSIEGELRAGAGRVAVPPAHLARFAREAPGPVTFSGPRGGRFLVLAGTPIDEPVVAYGPFVMHTPEALAQAFADVRAGRMGRLAPEEG